MGDTLMINAAKESSSCKVIEITTTLRKV
jgi:hypothetical protein